MKKVIAVVVVVVLFVVDLPIHFPELYGRAGLSWLVFGVLIRLMPKLEALRQTRT